MLPLLSVPTPVMPQNLVGVTSPGLPAAMPPTVPKVRVRLGLPETSKNLTTCWPTPSSPTISWLSGRSTPKAVALVMPGTCTPLESFTAPLLMVQVRPLMVTDVLSTFEGALLELCICTVPLQYTPQLLPPSSHLLRVCTQPLESTTASSM